MTTLDPDLAEFVEFVAFATGRPVTMAAAPVAPQADPPPGPAPEQVALGGQDGERAEQLLDAAKAEGVAVISTITRQALARWLDIGTSTLLHADRLYNDDERQQLANALAATNATANLLGRSRVRLRQQRAEAAAGAAKFSDPTDFSAFADSTIKPLPPLRALEYFKGLVPQIGGTVQGRLNDGSAIEFVTHPNAQNDEVLVRVDPAKLDPAWQANRPFYIPPGGGGAEIPGRRPDFERFLGTGKPIESPRVSLNPDGSLEFIDGRHRFSVLRDDGANRIGVMVPADQAEAFRRQFGAVNRGTTPGRFGQAMEREAFTLAATTDQMVLEKVKAAITSVLETGNEVRATPRKINRILDEAGVTPKNPQYAEMVMRTNMKESYNVGADQERMDPDVVETFPVWRYIGIHDGRERDRHRAHFDRYFPADVSFAEVRDSIAGKFDGYNCRCDQVPIDKWEWAKLVAAGARIADGYKQVPAMRLESAGAGAGVQAA